MPLTVENFAAYLAEKGVKRSCEQCGAESWVFVEPPDAATAWALDSRRSDDAHVVPSPAVPCVAMCCNNCSFIKLFASIPIESWIKEREGGKQ